MQVAVTGGSGQLGTLVLRRLIAMRKVKRVVSIDVQPPLLVSGKLAPVECDVRDPDIGKHLAGCDAVFHLAFVVTSKLPRATFDAINVGGSENVFRAGVAAGVTRFVYASSVAAYGVFNDHPEPILETTPRRHQPGFPYSSAKFRVEAFLDELEREHPDLCVARLRPAILIGTRFQNPLARLLGHALDLGFLPGQSGVPMPLVWDEDVADAAITAFEKSAKGAFNLASERATTPEDIAKELGLLLLAPPPALLGASAALAPIAERFGLGDPIDPGWADFGGVRMVMSSARAKAELDWKPRCDSGAAVIRRYMDEAPGRLNTKVALFMRAIALASSRLPEDADLKGMDARVHLALTGKGGGDFALCARNGRIHIERGVPRPPTSTATMRVETFLDLSSGKTEYATAQLTGRIRNDGDPSSGFVLGALLRRFRNLTQAEGWRGQTARRFARWLEHA